MTFNKPQYIAPVLNVLISPLLVFCIRLSFILLTVFLISILIFKTRFYMLWGLLFTYIMYLPYIIFKLGDDPLNATHFRYLIHFFVFLLVLFYFKFEVLFMTKKFNQKYFVEYWANGTFDFIFDFWGYFWFALVFVKYQQNNEE